MAAKVAPKGLGPQDSTEKLAQWVDLLGQPLPRKHVFKIFGAEPLPLNLVQYDLTSVSYNLLDLNLLDLNMLY